MKRRSTFLFGEPARDTGVRKHHAEKVNKWEKSFSWEANEGFTEEGCNVGEVWKVGFNRAFGLARSDEVAYGCHDRVLSSFPKLINYLCKRGNFSESDGFHGRAKGDRELDVHMGMS